MILLEGVKIDCSYISGSTVYSNPTRMSASPSPSPHGSSQGGSGSGIISAGSGSGSGTITSGNLYTFSIIAQNGDTHEFLCESENDRLRWVKLLQLLIMFPHSTIPAEPTNIPFNESMRANLEAKTYNAGRLWGSELSEDWKRVRVYLISNNRVITNKWPSLVMFPCSSSSLSSMFCSVYIQCISLSLSYTAMCTK